MPSPPNERADQVVPWIGLVDDDPSLRSALARGLRSRGIRVQAFESAEEYLQRAGDSDVPACMVVDICLGRSSGFDLQDALVSRGDETPIIFITSHEGMLAQSARDRTPCGCLIKPFEIDMLVSLVRPHLSTSSE